MISGTQFKESTHNGVKCLEPYNDANEVVSGMGAAAGLNLPLCTKLREQDRINAAGLSVTGKNTGFDPVQWVKDNPLLAGAAALASYFLFFKK